MGAWGPEQAQGRGGRLWTSLGWFRKTPPPRQLKSPHLSEAWVPRIFNLTPSTLGQGLAPKIGFTTTMKTFHNRQWRKQTHKTSWQTHGQSEIKYNLALGTRPGGQGPATPATPGSVQGASAGSLLSPARAMKSGQDTDAISEGLVGPLSPAQCGSVLLFTSKPAPHTPIHRPE